VQGDRTESVGGNLAQHIDGTLTTIVGKEEAATGYSNVYVYGDHSLGASGNIRISALESIRLECGGSVLSLTPQALQAASTLLAMAGSSQLYMASKGPAITLTDHAEIAAKTISLISSGASLSLNSNASLQASAVSLGSVAQSASAASSTSLAIQKKSFNLTLSDPNQKPYANKKYTLLVDGDVTTGTTDGGGAIAASISPTATLAHVTLWTGDYPEGPRLRWELQLADKLEDPSSPQGALDRLRNLGFYTGSVGTTMTDSGVAALTKFQVSQGLPTTAQLDGLTVQALSAAHGH
jgi:hypothetical protein